MFKILIGNALFFGLLAGWYFYTNGDRTLLAPGVILAFGSFVCGIVMGYVLHPPQRKPARATRVAAPVASVEPLAMAVQQVVSVQPEQPVHVVPVHVVQVDSPAQQAAVEPKADHAQAVHVEVPPAQEKLLAFLDGPGGAFLDASHVEGSATTEHAQLGVVD